MAGSGSSSSSSKASNATRTRKRVEAESSSSLKRAKDGSAFAKCEECNKDVPVALISFHNCSLDAKIKMNLETQIVEIPSEGKKKPSGEKKKAKSTTESKGKKAKNQSGRKKPLTAFFLFMKDFRKTFKEANPDCKNVSTVAKEGGDKWRSLSDEEKKVYTDMAAQLKAEFEKDSESNDAEAVDDEQEVEEIDDEQVAEEEEEIKIEEHQAKEKRRRLRKKNVILEEDEEIKDDIEEIKEEDEEIKEEDIEIKVEKEKDEEVKQNEDGNDE